MSKSSDTVTVIIAFSKNRAEQGQRREVTRAEARELVRTGAARYATDAQERKAEPAKAAAEK